jgi:hypothetical protein
VDDFWKEIGKILGLLSLGVVLLFAERMRAWLTEWWKSRGLNPIARAVKMCRAIHELLVELRVQLDADRVYVMQFHNGQVFTSNNPVYRMSCTQETVCTAVSRQQDKLQGIMVETAWRELEPMFGDQELAGIELIHEDEADEGKLPLRGTYYYRVASLPEGAFKSSMIARGVVVAAISPMLDPRRNIVGFVAADFCSDKFKEDATMPTELHRVTHCAANVWYALQQHMGGKH